jgi:hypothetical protein
MKGESLKKAAELAKKLGHVFVATADAAGFPHVAAAARLSILPEERVAVSAWFCPSTLANVQENGRISLVVWDAITDKGYQLLGELEEAQDLAILNGYSPDVEADSPLPQVESRLIIKIHKILDFTHAPHSDVEHSNPNEREEPS